MAGGGDAAAFVVADVVDDEVAAEVFEFAGGGDHVGAGHVIAHDLDAEVAAGLDDAFDGFGVGACHDDDVGGTGFGHHFCFEVATVHGFEVGDDGDAREGIAEGADPVEAFGEEEGCACFEPVDPGAEGHAGGFEGFVDAGEVEGDLDDGIHGGGEWGREGRGSKAIGGAWAKENRTALWGAVRRDYRREPVAGRLLAGFGLFVSGFPAGDAGGEVLDVGVAEFLGGVGRGGVGVATWAAAISDDESLLVGWELRLEGILDGVEVESGWDVAGFPRVAAIDVDDDGLFVGDGLLEVGDADVREFTGEDIGDGEEAEEESEEFFHGMFCGVGFLLMKPPLFTETADWVPCGERGGSGTCGDGEKVRQKSLPSIGINGQIFPWGFACGDVGEEGFDGASDGSGEGAVDVGIEHEADAVTEEAGFEVELAEGGGGLAFGAFEEVADEVGVALDAAGWEGGFAGEEEVAGEFAGEFVDEGGIVWFFAELVDGFGGAVGEAGGVFHDEVREQIAGGARVIGEWEVFAGRVGVGFEAAGDEVADLIGVGGGERRAGGGDVPATEAIGEWDVVADFVVAVGFLSGAVPCDADGADDEAWEVAALGIRVAVHAAGGAGEGGAVGDPAAVGDVEDHAGVGVEAGDFETTAGDEADEGVFVEVEGARVARVDDAALEAGGGEHHELGAVVDLEGLEERGEEGFFGGGIEGELAGFDVLIETGEAVGWFPVPVVVRGLSEFRGLGVGEGEQQEECSDALGRGAGGRRRRRLGDGHRHSRSDTMA